MRDLALMWEGIERARAQLTSTRQMRDEYSIGSSVTRYSVRHQGPDSNAASDSPQDLPHYPVDNLAKIVESGCLVSDRAIIERGGPSVTIGMSRIKQRRLYLPVHCHSGDCVGDYVPFYFCPRSVMLYLIYKANHTELTYHGGQGPIVHLEADLEEAIAWADSTGHRWAFTGSNAGAIYAQFHSSVDDLEKVNWNAVHARNWSDEDVKEGKQAEFLLHREFPLDMISRIGVCDTRTRQHALDALANSIYNPPISVMSSWYY